MSNDNLTIAIDNFFHSIIDLSVKETSSYKSYEKSCDEFYNVLKSLGLNQKECITVDDKRVYCESLLFDTLYKIGFIHGLNFKDEFDSYVKPFL